MSFEVKFVNHACFQIIKKDYSILVDPWFSGKVFNDSWELLNETNIDDLDLSNLKYIFISHEHPDHLSWSTLKKIKEKCNKPVQILMPKRDNKNVREFIDKMGYQFVEFHPYEQYTNTFDNFSFTFIKSNHDSAIIFDVDDQIILNINDCELEDRQIILLKNYIEKFLNKQISILLNQFSLAGYYANAENKEKLEEAKNKHISRLIDTSKMLNPKITVPFASFVNFCRPENFFLNDYIVDLESVVRENSNMDIFVPYYLENIPFEMDSIKSQENCKKWSKHFQESIKKGTRPVETVQEGDLIESYGVMQAEIQRLISYNSFRAPEEDFILHLSDTGKYCIFSFSKHFIEFVNDDNLEFVPIASVCTYDFLGFLKNPWGADTMNITSCFSVKDEVKWNRMLGFRDACYVR